MDISKDWLTKYKNTKDYLKVLKKILNLENPIDNEIEKDKKSLLEIINENEYVITNDNFKKMILILYRIIGKIPVILMGETGCGKTALIRKLNHLLNNGEETLEVININPSYTNDIIIERMNKTNKKVKEKRNKELWIYFNELNICDSLVLITEFFINGLYNREKT